MQSCVSVVVVSGNVRLYIFVVSGSDQCGIQATTLKLLNVDIIQASNLNCNEDYNDILNVWFQSEYNQPLFS